ncbi:MAG: hypothetical protein R3F13_06560 [Prosthecobacter sp.]
MDEPYYFSGKFRKVHPSRMICSFSAWWCSGGIGLGNIRVVGGGRVAGVFNTAGLFAAHFGLRPETGVAHFLKEFGLVLFVFALRHADGAEAALFARKQGRGF